MKWTTVIEHPNYIVRQLSEIERGAIAKKETERRRHEIVHYQRNDYKRLSR